MHLPTSSQTRSKNYHRRSHPHRIASCFPYNLRYMYLNWFPRPRASLPIGLARRIHAHRRVLGYFQITLIRFVSIVNKIPHTGLPFLNTASPSPRPAYPDIMSPSQPPPLPSIPPSTITQTLHGSLVRAYTILVRVTLCRFLFHSLSSPVSLGLTYT